MSSYPIVDKGEGVIIPAPYWVSYPEMVKIAEGKPSSCMPVSNRFQNHRRTTEKSITPKTRALIYALRLNRQEVSTRAMN